MLKFTLGAVVGISAYMLLSGDLILAWLVLHVCSGN
jgi:hypothetical protein